MGKYGRLLGWLYVGDDDTSLNEKMITEGYAWDYDGGTKQKNFEELREIRRSFGTLDQGCSYYLISCQQHHLEYHSSLWVC